MGQLADFFIASEGDFDPTRLLEQSPRGVFPCVQYKNIDPVNLATLQHIVSGVKCERAVAEINAGLITKGDGGPWVFRLSNDLCAALAGFTRPSAQKAAVRWIETQEWKLQGATSKDLPDFTRMLLDIGGLAKQALSEGKRLYLWMSL